MEPKTPAKGIKPRCLLGFYLANSRIRVQRKGELRMNKFDNFRAILSQFTSEISPLASEKAKAAEEIKNTYLPAVQEKELERLNGEYNQKEKVIRSEYLSMLENSVKTMQAAEQGKTTSRIDFELLNELNILSSAGIPLSKEEISIYAEKALRSGSSICCRKITDMAGKSGFRLSLPDEATAISILEEAAERLIDCVKRFDGNTKIDNTTSTDERMVKMAASGLFLDSLERKFSSVTSADLVIDEFDENGEKIERKEIEKTPLNFSISLDDSGKESDAAKYAREYSERMAATPIEVGGI